MLDHGPQTLPSGSAFRGAPDDGQRLTATEIKRLRPQVDQQRLALTHLSEALLGLRRGTGHCERRTVNCASSSRRSEA